MVKYYQLKRMSSMNVHVSLSPLELMNTIIVIMMKSLLIITSINNYPMMVLCGKSFIPIETTTTTSSLSLSISSTQQSSTLENSSFKLNNQIFNDQNEENNHHIDKIPKYNWW